MLDTRLQTIHTTLLKLGLGTSDITIYFLGLKLGSVTIKQLSDESKLGRITVHEIVRRLITKGLFLESYTNKKRIVYPNTVDVLERLLDTQKLAFQHLTHDVQHASNLLRGIQSQAENFPKMRCYKGKEGIQKMMTEILQDHVDIYMMSDGQHFYDLIDTDFLETSLSIRQHSNISIQMIFPTGFEYFTYTQGTYQQQLDIKSLPEESLLKGGCTIRGNKIAFHCYEDIYITTTILENPSISAMQRFLFDTLWEKAERY
jgi:predicted DNA-binding transcriptional regulator